MFHFQNKKLVKVSSAMLVAGGLMTGLAVTSAQADIIQAKFTTVTPSRHIQVSEDAGSHWHNEVAGNFQWTRLGGDYAGNGAQGTYTTYCIDLNQYISYGHTYNFDVATTENSPSPTAGMGAQRADLLSELFGRYWNDSFDTEHAAAFQAAVWETTADDGLQLDDGQIRIKDQGDFYGIAQGWLNTLDGTGPCTSLLVMSSPTAQDQVFVVPNPGVAAMLGLAGVCGLSVPRRRKINADRA